MRFMWAFKDAAKILAGAAAGGGIFNEYNKRKSPPNTSTMNFVASSNLLSTPRFPNFSDSIPGNYSGPTFELSQDYPTSVTPSAKPWESIDYTMEPMMYLAAVKAYVLEGNVSSDWRVQNNQTRPWYHVPWLHTTSFGREFIHGLTRERTSLPRELGPLQTQSVQNWAIGFYNAEGGYTVGKVWQDEHHPDATQAQFPVGTAVVKILFTEATPTEVPELEGAFEWQANIHTSVDSTNSKVIKTVRLLQMDVAVRDSRADNKTGWVFGTFIYDKNSPGTTPWDKLIPVGLMWGNDPGVTPTDISTGRKQLTETFINPNVTALGRSRLGWGGRLNGPVDNFVSACMSCHSIAEAPTGVLVPPRNTSEQDRLRWFRNLKSNEPFDAGRISLDYSLQLAASLERFHRAQGDRVRFTMRTDSVPLSNEEERILAEESKWTVIRR